MQSHRKFKLIIGCTLFALVSLVASASHQLTASASVANKIAEPRISFTFDDGFASSLTNAAPALAEYGYTGTNYVITSCVGMTTIPNSCPAGGNSRHMTWNQIKQLQQNFGWEIGSHSVNHPLTSELSTTQIESEMAGSKAALSANGINATAFAAPYGDYDDRTLSAAARYYTSFRGFADINYNRWPYADRLLRVQQVQGDVSVATVEQYIDKAVADNAWLILVFHEISDVASSNPNDYEYSTANLKSIAAYAQQKGIKGTNISEGLVLGSDTDNLLTSPIEAQAIGNGWWTDSTANALFNSGLNGDYPNPTNSILLTSNSSKNIHLFSPKIAVNHQTKYVIKGHLSMSKSSLGDIGFYIDEYDSTGNWVSGVFSQSINTWLDRDISVSYTPTSSLVKSASLQVIVSANSNTKAYLGAVKWYDLTTPSTNPDPAPEPDPTPIPDPNPTPNLLSNGEFTKGLDDWTTDSQNNISLDAQGNGGPNETLHSAKLTSQSSRNSHLFSNKFNVANGQEYRLSAYIKVVNIGKGIGFYLDEYDSKGSWVSGKFAHTKLDTASGVVSFNYSPSSKNVTQTSLQVIVIAGNSTLVYLDNTIATPLENSNPPTPEPTPDPTPEPTPAPEPDPTPSVPEVVNLVSNGDFSAKMTSWTTDSANNIYYDTNNHGSGQNPESSIKLSSISTKNTHLFSEKIDVISSQKLTISTYINIVTTGNGIGLYIDEYDQANNWISGQYLYTKSDLKSEILTINYQPTSTKVKKASLQFIAIANPNLVAYIDDVRVVKLQ